MVNYTPAETAEIKRVAALVREEIAETRQMIDEEKEQGLTEEQLLVRAFGAFRHLDPTHMARVLAYVLVKGIPDPLPPLD